MKVPVKPFSFVSLHLTPHNSAVESIEALLFIDFSAFIYVGHFEVLHGRHFRNTLWFRWAFRLREWEFALAICLRRRSLGCVIDLDGDSANSEKSSSEEFHRYFGLVVFIIIICRNRVPFIPLDSSGRYFFGHFSILILFLGVIEQYENNDSVQKLWQ